MRQGMLSIRRCNNPTHPARGERVMAVHKRAASGDGAEVRRVGSSVWGRRCERGLPCEACRCDRPPARRAINGPLGVCSNISCTPPPGNPYLLWCRRLKGLRQRHKEMSMATKCVYRPPPSASPLEAARRPRPPVTRCTTCGRTAAAVAAVGARRARATPGGQRSGGGRHARLPPRPPRCATAAP
jgi:hypothetical protein